jgi:AcrR family transcriptional regulator
MNAKPAPKRGRPTDEESRARKREEILACAARVFAANGFPGTDVQAVADAAGVAKGTLYLYFPSKEEMFLAAVDQGIKQLKAYIDSCTADLADPLERIGAAIHAYLRFFKKHPELVELLILERAAFRDRKTPTYFQHREAGRAEWHAILQGLIDAGRLRDLPISRIDDVLSDLVYGTMFTNHFSGRHKPVEEQARDILDIVHHGILSEGERRRRPPQERRKDAR